MQWGYDPGIPERSFDRGIDALRTKLQVYMQQNLEPGVGITVPWYQSVLHYGDWGCGCEYQPCDDQCIWNEPNCAATRACCRSITLVQHALDRLLAEPDPNHPITVRLASYGYNTPNWNDLNEGIPPKRHQRAREWEDDPNNNTTPTWPHVVFLEYTGSSYWPEDDAANVLDLLRRTDEGSLHPRQDVIFWLSNDSSWPHSQAIIDGDDGTRRLCDTYHWPTREE